jgi:hypothetical protein
VERFVRKLEKKCPRLHFCYEAGPTGYGFYRQIVDLGHRCDVVAPSLIPKRAGERVKTNRRDAISLARLLRAGELKGIWVPDAVHEAVRDMMRVRSAASEDLRKKRQQLLSFLLRHGRIFTGRKVEGAWSYSYPARVTEPIRVRLEGLPKSVRDIAWKAQTRLCARYPRMTAAGKKTPVVVAAIAREMAAFLWAIGHQVEPGR